MASKLEGNGLFESSRMMLPEHKEAIIKYNVEQKRRQRIELDEQELEQINIALYQSMKHRVAITIKMYHPFEYPKVIGVVDRIDRQLGRFRVDGEWFILGDIEEVEFEEI